MDTLAGGEWNVAGSQPRKHPPPRPDAGDCVGSHTVHRPRTGEPPGEPDIPRGGITEGRDLESPARALRGVAQLAERSAWDREAAGSTPASPTMNQSAGAACGSAWTGPPQHPGGVPFSPHPPRGGLLEQRGDVIPVATTTVEPTVWNGRRRNPGCAEPVRSQTQPPPGCSRPTWWGSAGSHPPGRRLAWSTTRHYLSAVTFFVSRLPSVTPAARGSAGVVMSRSFPSVEGCPVCSSGAARGHAGEPLLVVVNHSLAEWRPEVESLSPLRLPRSR